MVRRVNRTAPASSAKPPAFTSPYQPPSSIDDLSSDALSPEWYTVDVWGQSWRVKRPQPRAVYVLGVAMRQTKNTDATRVRRADTLRDYLSANMHPDDFERLLMRMLSPNEDAKGMMFDMVRAISTAGTARPFARLRRLLS